MFQERDEGKHDLVSSEVVSFGVKRPKNDSKRTTAHLCREDSDYIRLAQSILGNEFSDNPF